MPRRLNTLLDPSAIHYALKRLGYSVLLCFNKISKRYGAQRLYTSAPFGAWRTQTFIAGLASDTLIAPWGLDGAMNGNAFETYVRTQLAPALQPKTVAILDNLAVHKNHKAAEALRKKGGWFLFPPPLDAVEQEALRAFIIDLAASPSRLIMTSRTREDWLGGGDQIERLPIGGLRQGHAGQYVDIMLQDNAAAQANRAAEPEAFGGSTDHLRGNPLSLRVVMVRLDETPPAAMLAALKDADETLPPGFEGNDLTTSFGASRSLAQRGVSRRHSRRAASVQGIRGSVQRAYRTEPQPSETPQPLSSWALRKTH